MRTADAVYVRSDARQLTASLACDYGPLLQTEVSPGSFWLASLIHTNVTNDGPAFANVLAVCHLLDVFACDR